MRATLLAGALGVAAGATAAPEAPGAPPPQLLFTDLVSGPNSGGPTGAGAFVTLFGNGFGAVQAASSVSVGGGAPAAYVQWSNTRIVIQLGAASASGDLAVHRGDGATSATLPFTIRPGRVLFVDPRAKSPGDGSAAKPWRSPTSLFGALKPGDTVYFRAGRYHDNFGGDWGNRNLELGARFSGTQQMPIALVGYPGEAAVFESPAGESSGTIVLKDTSETVPKHLVIANLVLRAQVDCIFGGGYWETAKSGASDIRVVGNRCSASYKGNTMTGLVALQGDHWQVLGNLFENTGVDPTQKNNHGIYVQCGASDVDIGWNQFRNLKLGHVILVHTDKAFAYEDVRIHDNLIAGNSPADTRGIAVGNVAPSSYGAIYNNVLVSLGQDFSGIGLLGGKWQVHNNTLVNVDAGSGMIWISGKYGGIPTASIANNILVSNGRSPYVAAMDGAVDRQMIAANNLYWGYERWGFRSGPDRDVDSTAVVLKPEFMDAAAGDYRLTPAARLRSVTTVAGERLTNARAEWTIGSQSIFADTRLTFDWPEQPK